MIIMTGHSDVATCTESFRNGAFDFIEKPADDDFLIQRIHHRDHGRHRTPPTGERIGPRDSRSGWPR